MHAKFALATPGYQKSDFCLFYLLKVQIKFHLFIFSFSCLEAEIYK